MMSDPVVWGSFLVVIISIVILGFLIFKIKKLMDKDAEAHKQ